MDSYNTPGVPEPEVSARSMRDATRAFPDDNNMSPPRNYEQTIRASDLPSQVANTNGDAYQD